jgi:hypothetical protein
MPPARPAVAIVQVSGGSLTGPPNPCYRQEALWAGRNLEAYIFLDGLSSATPGGTCHGDFGCESYLVGWVWTRHWMIVARANHADPRRWWLDVENTGRWGANPASNARVVAGAVAALKAAGKSVGIYSTGLQWNTITGGLRLKGVELWVAGAGNRSGAGYTAASYCRSSQVSFAGGRVTLVQYGYTGAFPGSYTGPQVPYDLDYACRNWVPPTSLHARTGPRGHAPHRAAPLIRRPRSVPVHRAAPARLGGGLRRVPLDGPAAGLLQAVGALS